MSLYKKCWLLLLCKALLITTIIAPLPGNIGKAEASGYMEWDTYSDTWAATDELGRTLPTYEEVGPVRQDKYVGIFYHLWHHDVMYHDGGRDPGAPRDITDILSHDPEAIHSPQVPPWGGYGNYHYWGEPLLGYYDPEVDRYALKKHAQMLADIGVDTLILDFTNFWAQGVYNGAYYNWDALINLLEAFTEVRAAGGKTPQFVVMATWTGINSANSVKQIYDDLYSKNLYSDLWFKWEGKPLIIADPSAITDQRIRDFFTFRTGHPEYTAPDQVNKWPWLSIYPQQPGFTESNATEAVAVGVAQNWTTGLSYMSAQDTEGHFIARGRSYQNGKQPLNKDPMSPDYPSAYGYNFQEGLDRALEIDPNFMFVTAWNEWLAIRFDRKLYSTGDEYPPGGLFVDVYTPEFSRDIEPTRDGGIGDNYYLQLAAAIRKYKGVRVPAESGPPQTIAVNGQFADWADVQPEYRDDINDKATRNNVGLGNDLHYFNDTGRNDFKLAKVARDDQYIYFYVETVDDITSYEDPNWMRLFIKTNDSDPNWSGYNYVINRTGVAGTTTTLEKSTGDWNWTTVDAEIQYRAIGNKLELAIPRPALGLDDPNRPLDIQFKWNDNMQVQGDSYDFYLNGDSAPNGRFNYRYSEKTQMANFPENLYAANGVASDTVLEGAASLGMQYTALYPFNGIEVKAKKAAWTRVDDTGSNIQYSERWAVAHNDSSYKGSEHYANGEGDFVEFTFTGTGIRWIGDTNPDHGKVKVYINNIYQETIDTYSGRLVKQTINYEKADLPYGTHTIKIEVTHEKNDNAMNGFYQSIDGFEYFTETQGDVALSLYKWDTNYSTTLASAPIATQTFSDSSYANGSWLKLNVPEQVPGEYFWHVTAPAGSAAFVHYMNGNYSAVTYDHGQPTSGNYASRILYLDNIAAAVWSSVDDADERIAYSGWGEATDAGYYDGTLHFTNADGATATFTFTGTGIRWIGSKNIDRGKADVYINDVFQTTIDNYAEYPQLQQVLYENNNLPQGTHTLKIIVSNSRHDNALDSYQDVDRLEFLGYIHSAPQYAAGYPAVDAVKETVAQVKVKSNKTGYVHYVVLPSGSQAPSVEQVRRGSGANGDVVSSGKVVVVANQEKSITIPGLVMGTGYDVYTIAADNRAPATYQTTVNKVSFVTRQPATWIYIDDGDSAVNYSAGWGSLSEQEGAYGNTMHFTNLEGATAEIVFHGQGIRWIGSKNIDRGEADIYLDDVYQMTVDNYASHPLKQQVLYENNQLRNGQHTLRIVTRASRNPNAVDSYQDVDAFMYQVTDLAAPVNATGYPMVGSITETTATVKIKTNESGKVYVIFQPASVEATPAVEQVIAGVDSSGQRAITATSDLTTDVEAVLTGIGLIPNTQYDIYVVAQDYASIPNVQASAVKLSIKTKVEAEWTRVEDTDSRIIYERWNSAAGDVYSGGNVHYSNYDEAYVEFTFTGTGIRWIGTRNVDHGKAAVYIDGRYQATVDTYSEYQQMKQIVYSNDELPGGQHTIRIVVTHSSNSNAIGTYQDLDYLEYIAMKPSVPGGGSTIVGNDTSVVKSVDGSIVIPRGRAGEITLADEVTIRVPAGAAEEELRITLQQLLDSTNLVFDHELLIGHVYEAIHNRTDRFELPITITMKFDPLLVGDHQSIAIYYYNEEGENWVSMGGSINGNQITATVDYLAKFAVLAVDKEQPAVPIFTDIDGHWASNIILNALDNKLIQGYPDGTFRPDATITRAEFTVMLVNALKLEGAGEGRIFKDQEQIGSWAKEAVTKAVDAGIVNGYGDGSFRPDLSITRAEIATMIARGLQLSSDADAMTGFIDDHEIPTWAKGAVKALQERGIVNGRGGHRFVPNVTATRAESAVMLVRLLSIP